MILEFDTSKFGSVLYKFSRSSATHERKMETIRDYPPYFYVRGDEPQETHTLEGIPVEKRFVRNPWDIKELKETCEHYEADVPYTSRYMLDKTTLPLEDDYLRTLYIDIETYTHAGEPFPDQETAPHRICLICVYDNLTEEYYTFDNQDEYELLRDFARFVRDANPDVMTAWNSDFDFATIYNRMTQNYLNPKMLSPLDYASYKPEFGVRISGVDTLDLLELYKKLHFGELESFALNSVGSYELDLEKIDTGNELPGDMLDNGHAAELEEYCLRDVEIMVELDKKMNIIGFYHLLQRLSGLPNIGSATSNSRIHDMLILRKAHEQNIILPSKVMREKIEIVGARVLDPVPGLHEDVAVLDIVGMYSNIFLTTNAGYETVSRTPRANSVKIKTDTRTLYVDQTKKSLWVEVLEDLMEERMKHKKAMQDSVVDTPEYDYHHTNQFAIKTLIASAYGVSNFRNFRLYSSDVSNIITFMGREMNKHMQGIVESEGFSCVGGDTDSLFVTMGSQDIAVATSLADSVNQTWGDMLSTLGIAVDSHSFELEFDAMYDRFFAVDAKKRYCGHYTYKNGDYADDIKIVGFQFKRSDTSHVTKQLQQEVFDIILNDPIPEVGTNVKTKIKGTLDNLKDEDYSDIGIPKGFKKDPREYKIQNLNTKAVIYSQENLGMGSISVVKPMIFAVKRVKPDSNYPDTKSIAVDPSDNNQMDIIRDNFDLDYTAIERKVIHTPMEKILDAFDISMGDIKTGTTQASLFSF